MKLRRVIMTNRFLISPHHNIHVSLIHIFPQCSSVMLLLCRLLPSSVHVACSSCLLVLLQMANNLMQQVQQLKIMIEQMKQQTQISKESVVQEIRELYEKEKNEVKSWRVFYQVGNADAYYRVTFMVCMPP